MATTTDDKTVKAKAEPAAHEPGVQRFEMVSPAQSAARALADEQAERRASGTQLDKTRPGGYYLDHTGQAHDAHGNRIGKGDKKDDASHLSFDEINTELAENEKRRLSLLAHVEAARAASLAAAVADSAKATAKAAE